ncbi:hypothetical protein [Enterococcus sp. AZ196]|uniref:hypothetical protein n=1 Tax=Enterococcus sp. AZ196 TaxID=2774659 RepID=UPI003D2ADB0E
MIDREEMKIEAIQRMEMMGIHRETIHQFKEENLLSYSMTGVNYWFSDQHKQIIQKFEEDQKCLVYFGILNKVNLVPTLSLFYVPGYGEDLNYRKEWLIDRHDISEGECLAYVHNLENEHYSEIGYIGFRPLNGGLQRQF